MESVKQQAINVINHLPENVSFDEIVYTLYIKKGINEGLKDIKKGNFKSQEEVEMPAMPKIKSDGLTLGDFIKVRRKA